MNEGMPELGLLRWLEHTHAFDPVPIPGYRTSLYVPFEELTQKPCESRLADGVDTSQRTALIGPVGCGKSSLVEFVMTEERSIPLAPLWVSAAHEGDETLVDPVEFARHMIRQIVRWASEVGAMTEEELLAARAESASSYERTTRRRADTIGVKLAVKWIEPSWSREIEETLADPEVTRSRTDFVDSLDRLVELIYQQGRTPVVVIDDSDRFLKRKSSARDEVLEPFFRETCRMLAERNWGVVLAVNPEYCTSASFRRALTEGFVNNQLDLPRLTEPSALRALIDARITRRAHERESDAEFRAVGDAYSFDDAGAAHVFEDGFEDVLFERYTSTEGNLRSVLTVVDQALRETIALSERRITNAALQQTILALSP